MLPASIVQIAIMTLVPVAAGIYWCRRTRAPWQLLLVGAATFVASQLVHFPLNFAIDFVAKRPGMPAPTGTMALVLTALILGFTAGLCEEVARWLVLRFTWKRRPDWMSRGGAIAHGLGHGGFESMILGGLVTLTVVNMVMLRDLGPDAQLPGASPEDMAALRTQIDAFWSTHWAMTLVSAAERLMTMVAHVALSTLVGLAVIEGRRSLLVAAIGWHWALDALAVFLHRMVGIWAAETLVAVNVVVALLVLRRIRKRWPTGEVSAT